MATEKMMCGTQNTDTFTRESGSNFRFGNCKDADTMPYFYVLVATKKRHRWENDTNGNHEV